MIMMMMMMMFWDSLLLEDTRSTLKGWKSFSAVLSHVCLARPNFYPGFHIRGCKQNQGVREPFIPSLLIANLAFRFHPLSHNSVFNPNQESRESTLNCTCCCQITYMNSQQKKCSI